MIENMIFWYKKLKETWKLWIAGIEVLYMYNQFIDMMIPATCTFKHDSPVKIQIRLRESSLCAFWIAKDAKFLHMDNEYSDCEDAQADLSLRWVHMSDGTFSHVQVEPKQNNIIEPAHDKTYKMACAPSEDSDQTGHPPSLIRVFAVLMKKVWALSYPLSAQRRLIRLGGCPGWSESSLGAHAIL